MGQLVRGEAELARHRLPKRGRRGELAKTLPFSALSCVHALASWRPVRPKRPSLFPDGNPRPVALLGGTLRRHVAQCALRPGHTGQHQTIDGRTW